MPKIVLEVKQTVLNEFRIAYFAINISIVFEHSIISRAVKSKKVSIKIYHLADFAQSTNSSRKILDSPPYGGGPGMVLRPEPLYNAVNKIKENKENNLWMKFLS